MFSQYHWIGPVYGLRGYQTIRCPRVCSKLITGHVSIVQWSPPDRSDAFSCSLFFIVFYLDSTGLSGDTHWTHPVVRFPCWNLTRPHRQVVFCLEVTTRLIQCFQAGTVQDCPPNNSVLCPVLIWVVVPTVPFASGSYAFHRYTCCAHFGVSLEYRHSSFALGERIL